MINLDPHLMIFNGKRRRKKMLLAVQKLFQLLMVPQHHLDLDLPILQDKIHLISKELNIHVTVWDERLSTVASFNLSSQLDVNVSKRVKNIDQNSAAFILQGVLDYLNK